jgi:hypothetical protein
MIKKEGAANKKLKDKAKGSFYQEEVRLGDW